MTHLSELPEYLGPGRLWRVPGGCKDAPPVLLTHGTFSNAAILQPIAQFLADQGRRVFVIEWRGRDGRPPNFTFHDLADGEIAHAMRHVGEPMHLVGHSGGGLALCFAQMQPDSRALTQSLTLIATQGTHLSQAAPQAYWSIRALSLFSRLWGHWPTGFPRLGPCNESAALLAQWVHFNKTHRIFTRDGSDLLPKLGALALPVLALAGQADTVIARPEGCRTLADAFGDTAQFHICDDARDGEDFTHTRLIRSRAAARSVWPRIVAFANQTDQRAAPKQG